MEKELDERLDRIEQVNRDHEVYIEKAGILISQCQHRIEQLEETVKGLVEASKDGKTLNNAPSPGKGPDEPLRTWDQLAFIARSFSRGDMAFGFP